VTYLISIVDQVNSDRPALLRALADGELKRRELSNSSTRELVPVVVKSEDDQYYYMMTGRSEARGTTGGTDTLAREEFLRYKHLSCLLRAIGVAHSSLSAAFEFRIRLWSPRSRRHSTRRRNGPEEPSTTSPRTVVPSWIRE